MMYGMGYLPVLFSHFTLIIRLLKKQPGVPASYRNHFDFSHRTDN